jgi:hypothetical protein
MSRTSNLSIGALSLVVALAAGIVSAIGVFARGDGAVAVVTSVRGETYEMATSGVYANNAQRVVAEGVGWDVFTLLVAAPAMIIAAWLVGHGSFRGRLIAAGLFGYFLYAYLEYTVTWAFGPLFLAYVSIYGASLIGIGLVAVDLGRAGVDGRFGPGLPSRAWPVLLVTMSVLLTLSWLSRIGQALGSGVDGLLLGETTMTVQALDLGLVVPLSIVVAAIAWRGSQVAWAISAAYSVTFVAMTGAITSMMVSASLVEGVVEVVPLAIFGSAAIVGLWLAIRIFRSIIPEATSSPIPSLAPHPA